MERGYVKLYRKSLESAVWTTSDLWKVWSWCLLRGSWNVPKWEFNGQEITLHRGQFVTGRVSGAKDCRLKQSTFWRNLKRLEELGNIVIRSNNRYSIVTIVKYEQYQASLEKVDGSLDSGWTADGQQMDTIKKVRKEEGITEIATSILHSIGTEGELEGVIQKHVARLGHERTSKILGKLASRGQRFGNPEALDRYLNKCDPKEGVPRPATERRPLRTLPEGEAPYL